MRGNGPVRTGLLAGAVAAAFGMAAVASSPGEENADERMIDDPAASSRVPAESFSALDTNLDGVLSPQEARDSEVLEGRFGDADANRDGSIDQSEFAAYELLRQDDLEEAPPAMSPGGASGPDQLMDQDVPPTEEAAENMEQSAAERDAEAPRPVREPRPRSGRSERGLARSQGFENLDRDADGVISLEEAERHPSLGEQFGEADTDVNGRIDRGEFAAFELEQSANPPETERGRPIVEQPAPEN